MKVPAVNEGQLVALAIGAAALLVLGLVVYVALKGARGAARSAVDLAGNTTAGVVVGIGDQVGLPDPSTPEAQDKCASALAEGRTWEASLYCPAGTFLKYLATPRSSAPRDRVNVLTPDAAGWLE